MADTFQSVLIGGAAGLVSAVLTYFSTRAKTRLELAVEYDKTLRQSRLEAYKELWKMMKSIARFGRDRSVTYADLLKISNETRDWYFDKGGIYLTRSSRDPYFYWKKKMQPVLDDKSLASNPDTPIPPETLEGIIEAGSALRTSLSDDLGTKRASWL